MSPHPLLEQVPLTVSPFVSLPTATTLSYNYKNMPSNIPQSALGIPTATGDVPTSVDQPPPPPSSQQATPQQQPSSPATPAFIVSASGHAATPEQLRASCQALLRHVTQLQKDAERELREFEVRTQERDLAEKRRLAPGWLDSEARLLEPEKRDASPPSPKPPQLESVTGAGSNTFPAEALPLR